LRVRQDASNYWGANLQAWKPRSDLQNGYQGYDTSVGSDAYEDQKGAGSIPLARSTRDLKPCKLKVDLELDVVICGGGCIAGVYRRSRALSCSDANQRWSFCHACPATSWCTAVVDRRTLRTPTTSMGMRYGARDSARQDRGGRAYSNRVVFRTSPVGGPALRSSRRTKISRSEVSSYRPDPFLRRNSYFGSADC